MSSKKAQTKIHNKTAREISKERLHRITKSRKHRVRTTGRILKYGTKSFARNAWLSAAAIAIMAITLIVLGATIIATDVMQTVIQGIQDQVEISVYLKQDATQEQVDIIVGRMSQLDSVVNVAYTTPKEANDKTVQSFIEDNNITDETAIQEIRRAPNLQPWALNIKLKELDKTDELENFVSNDDSMQNMLDAHPPSYANKNRETIDRIADVMNRVQMIGLVAAAVFAVIAILVVFNTIRMAIFSRKEEIYMMKLVGASRGFITGPFLVEAALYGVLAAIIAGAVAYGSVYALETQMGAIISPTFNLMKDYWYYVVSAFLVCGIMIGVISSLLATRKYLKI